MTLLMSGFCVLGYFTPTHYDALHDWLNRTHRAFLADLGGLSALHVGKLSVSQGIRSQAQPYSAVLLHDFAVEDDAARITALEKALFEMPMDANASAPVFQVYRWKMDWTRPSGETGVMPSCTHWSIGLANCPDGQEDAFHRWQNAYHVPDLLRIPGVAAMRRGQLSPNQFAAPRDFTRKFAGIVGLHMQDPMPTLLDMKLRNMGKSESGIQFTPPPPGVVVPDTKASVFDMEPTVA